VLAAAGVHIQFNRNSINPVAEGPFDIDTRMANNIAVLTLFPGISQYIIDAAAGIKDNKILIIRTFGSGNAMTHPDFIDAMKRAIDRGVLLINVSQCRAGGVTQGKYQTSAELHKMGVIPAGDMMIEAAITKSMHLLGKGCEGDEFKKQFTSNLRGELTAPSS
jgi:L-asparaginase